MVNFVSSAISAQEETSAFCKTLFMFITWMLVSKVQLVKGEMIKNLNNKRIYFNKNVFTTYFKGL